MIRILFVYVFYALLFVYLVADDEFISFVKKTRIPLCTDRQMNNEQKNNAYQYQHVSE